MTDIHVQNFFDAPYWANTYFGNSLSEYVIVLVAFLVLLIALKVVQFIFLRILAEYSQKTKNTIDDLFLEAIKSIQPPFYTFVSFYIAIRLFLDLGHVIGEIFDALLIIWTVTQVVVVAQIPINRLVRRHLMKGENDSGEESIIGILGMISKVVLWVFGVLLILANLGFNIVSLIAGLGVLGIAVGLALQPIFTDLFAAFSIFFDKPFRVGDFISFSGELGTVEKIGIKSTRIRALSGEEVVLSNSDLISKIIHNINELKTRRVVFHFGVTRETGINRLREIPELVKNATEGLDLVKFDRAHFKQFDDSALTYEAVYYVESNDYTKYMDVQQEINLGICQRFAKEKIVMAYPTQTVYQYNLEGKGR